MQARRIVVAHESRLLRDMLKRMIGKTQQLQLVAEVINMETLPLVVKQTAAEWVIVSLGADGNVPEMVESLMVTHPSTGALAVSGEGDRIKMKRRGEHEQTLNISTVAELVQVLSGGREH
jgi:DNA-binding NarL/FixJ family response regulator